MEFTAKTVEEATSLALEEMKLTIDKVQIKVLEEPKKGFFGKLKGKAVIEVTKKDEEVSEEKVEPIKAKEVFEETNVTDKIDEKPFDIQKGAEKANQFIAEVLTKMGIDGSTELGNDGENPVITITTQTSSEIIGYRGEVLDALQTLAGAIANIGNKDYKKVVVDCENYRNKREDTLIALAHKLEVKATEMKREIILEPMNPFERRIIHTALADSEKVTTRSDGKEPNRYVVIVPNEKDEFSKPYNAGRNNGGRQDKFKHSNDKKFGGKSFKKGGYGGKKEQSGFTQQIRKKPSGFGTYLGNSLKNDK